jgi:hypothetical protein
MAWRKDSFVDMESMAKLYMGHRCKGNCWVLR